MQQIIPIYNYLISINYKNIFLINLIIINKGYLDKVKVATREYYSRLIVDPTNMSLLGIFYS